jgi:hypothetical protein
MVKSVVSSPSVNLTHMPDGIVFVQFPMPVAAALDILGHVSILMLHCAGTYIVPDSNPKIMTCSPRPTNFATLGMTPFSSCRLFISFFQISESDPDFHQCGPILCAQLHLRTVLLN